MKLVKHGAEFQLKQRLSKLTEFEQAQWVLVQYRLSTLNARIAQKDATNIAANTIGQQVESANCELYMCEDNDLLLLASAACQDVLDEIAYNLRYMFADAMSAEQAESFTHITLLSEQMDAAKELAERKLLKTLHTKNTPSGAANDAPTSPTAVAEGVTTHAKGSAPLLRILLVEDDPLSRRMAKNKLADDYDVIEAESGMDALAKYVDFEPDIVFLDIGLPDISGHDVLKKMMALDSETYAVMLSAHSFREDILLSQQLGAKGFVCKPFTQIKLLEYTKKHPKYTEAVRA